MIIHSFSIRHKDSLKEKTFSFDESIEYFYSQSNSVGKTTFLRGILYGFGFPIPSTKKINFDHYFFKINMTTDTGESLCVKRNNNTLSINDIEFNPQTELSSIVQRIFSIDNIDLINNFLAVIYIDQDKGWTVSSRQYRGGEGLPRL